MEMAQLLKLGLKTWKLRAIVIMMLVASNLLRVRLRRCHPSGKGPSKASIGRLNIRESSIITLFLCL